MSRKYKARRRAAELKLEAAQQNLTRIDDIVFEVEKQRGTLKRQAAKARRYQKLRDELRRWEKVLFARKLPSACGDHRSRARRLLDSAREREAAAAAHVAGDRSRSGPRYASSSSKLESRATSRRESRARVRADHQQPPAANRVRQGADSARLGSRLEAVIADLPSGSNAAASPHRRHAAVARAGGCGDANAERDRAAAMLASESDAYEVGAPRASKASKPTSKRRGAKCSRRSTQPRRFAIRSSMPRSARRPRR